MAATTATTTRHSAAMNPMARARSCPRSGEVLSLGNTTTVTNRGAQYVILATMVPTA